MTFLTSMAAARRKFYEFAQSEGLMVHKFGDHGLLAGDYALTAMEREPCLFYRDQPIDMAILGSEREIETLAKETA